MTNPLWRWMGSIAQDKQGDIAARLQRLGRRTTTRRCATPAAPAGDPPGQMTQAEQAAYTGTGPQTEAEGRWGDYSDLTVDPGDDCTFWYTQEYLESGHGRDRNLADAHRLVQVPGLQEVANSSAAAARLDTGRAAADPPSEPFGMGAEHPVRSPLETAASLPESCPAPTQ